jgi:hypothetical protein
MVKIKVNITDKDRRVGAMVKALAFDIAGGAVVSGCHKEFLFEHGYYIFHFPDEAKAKVFRQDLAKYISVEKAQLSQ